VSRIDTCETRLKADFKLISSSLSRLEDCPAVDLTPILDCVNGIEVNPVVKVNLQEVLDAVGAIDVQSISKALVQADAIAQTRSCQILDAVHCLDSAATLSSLLDEVRVMKATGEESRNAISRIHLSEVMDAIKQVDSNQASHSAFARALHDAIDAIDVKPEVHLDPVLAAIAQISMNPVLERIDIMQGRIASQIQDEHVDLQPVFEAIRSSSGTALEDSAKQNSELLRGLRELRSEFQRQAQGNTDTMVDMIKGIEAKVTDPPVNFAPVLDALDKLDLKPVIDLQPVIDVVGKFDVKDAVRPMMDVVRVGLTQIEQMKLQADHGPVLAAIQKVDQRIMEAIVRTDAETYPELKRNLRLAYQITE